VPLTHAALYCLASFSLACAIQPQIIKEESAQRSLLASVAGGGGGHAPGGGGKKQPGGSTVGDAR
jgi:hypothetical protein